LGIPDGVSCWERRGPWTAMDDDSGSRGELCTRGDSKGRGLGEIEEGLRVLTTEGIEFGSLIWEIDEGGLPLYMNRGTRN